MRRVEGDEGRRRSLANAGRRSRRSKTPVMLRRSVRASPLPVDARPSMVHAPPRLTRRVEGDEGRRRSLANGARRSRRSKTPVMLRRSVRASPLPVDARLRWFTLRHDLREESKGTKDGEEASRTGLEGAEGRRRSACAFDTFAPSPFNASPFDASRSVTIDAKSRRGRRTAKKPRERDSKAPKVED